jgi:uncharacterized membrane protein
MSPRKSRVVRILVMLALLVFVAGFAFLTFVSIVEQHGITLGGLLSIFILVLLSVGIVGALRNPPR